MGTKPAASKRWTQPLILLTIAVVVVAFALRNAWPVHRVESPLAHYQQVSRDARSPDGETTSPGGVQGASHLGKRLLEALNVLYSDELRLVTDDEREEVSRQCDEVMSVWEDVRAAGLEEQEAFHPTRATLTACHKQLQAFQQAKELQEQQAHMETEGTGAGDALVVPIPREQDLSWQHYVQARRVRPC